MIKITFISFLFFTFINGFTQNMGSLDLSFANTGYVITDFNQWEEGRSIAIQQDGKIILTGESGNDIAIARYNEDGILDNTFGLNGKVITSNGLTINPSSLALQQDGKIVLAGWTINNGGTNHNIAFVRYKTNGDLDSSFGSFGKVIHDFSNYGDGLYSVKIQPDGKIVASGYYFTNGTNSDFLIVRLNSDGTLDGSFGNGGIVVKPVGNLADFAVSLALQSNNKILIGGYSDNGSNLDISIVRFHSNGDIDSAFGNNGKVNLPIGNGNSGIQSICVQSDNNIVAAGFSYNAQINEDFTILRLDTNGVLDNTFGNGGITITEINTGAHERINSIAIQFNGKIIAVGESQNSGNSIALARYETNGSLDSSFGAGGIVITPVGSTAYSVAIQTDGDIVVGGRKYNGQNNDFITLRFVGDFKTEILENEDSEKISLFPNPVEGIISIKNIPINSMLSIYDIQHQLLNKISPSQNDIRIDLSNYKSGVYFIKLSTDKNTAVTKFIKK